MKYFVSDTKVLPNKFGKWYWYADEDCKTHQTIQKAAQGCPEYAYCTLQKPVKVVVRLRKRRFRVETYAGWVP